MYLIEKLSDNMQEEVLIVAAVLSAAGYSDDYSIFMANMHTYSIMSIKNKAIAAYWKI